MTLLGTLGLISVTVCVVGGSASSCHADTVTLRTGETVVGRVVLEQSDDRLLVVEEARSGARREFDWALVGEADAARLQAAGREGNGSNWYTAKVPGERISWRIEGGEREACGLVERESAGFLSLRAASSPDALRVAVADIVKRESIDLNPQDVWPSTDLFARKQRAIDPQDHRSWMRLASYGERVGADELARGAYERAAAATEDAPLRAAAMAAAARAAQRSIDEAEGLRVLQAARSLLEASRWAEARSALEAFARVHPGPTDRVRRAFEALRDDFGRLRIAHFAARAGAEYDEIGRRLVRERVRPRDARFDDVVAWMRKELPDEIIAALVGTLQREDPVVTAEDVRAFFTARPRSEAGWRQASLGSGTFLVRGAAVRPAIRESWWEGAPAAERARFVWASAVEQFGILEVRPGRDQVACVVCDGAGKLTKLGTAGASLEYVCPRCGGARWDTVIVYR